MCVSTALTCNGLEVYVDGECVESRPFERDSLVRAARVLAGCPGAGLVVYCGSGGHTPYIVGMRAESNPTLTDPQIFPFGFTQVDEVPDEPVVKAGVTCDAEQLPLGELYPRLCEACPELEFLQSIADWYDINPRGWSKADGVRILARHLGLGLDEIVAFGDQINDLEMLRLLPNSTAVANAVPAAAEAARWRIGACDEDGVAIAMEQILEVAGTDVPPAFMRG